MMLEWLYRAFLATTFAGVKSPESRYIIKGLRLREPVFCNVLQKKDFPGEEKIIFLNVPLTKAVITIR